MFYTYVLQSLNDMKFYVGYTKDLKHLQEEGYCRRSIKEYLNFLNISLGSLGESVSGLCSYRKAKQISEEQFERLDSQAYKLENGLLKLVESLRTEA